MRGSRLNVNMCPTLEIHIIKSPTWERPRRGSQVDLFSNRESVLRKTNARRPGMMLDGAGSEENNTPINLKIKKFGCQRWI